MHKNNKFHQSLIVKYKFGCYLPFPQFKAELGGYTYVINDVLIKLNNNKLMSRVARGLLVSSFHPFIHLLAHI